MDYLGYDELWIGEHHSAGSEIIAAPEIFIAAAAERTRNIKLGTGVTSVAYHNPLWVADRMVMLDHLIEQWFRYFQWVAAFPQMSVEGNGLKEMIDFINEAGVGAIGTPADARAQVQRLWDQSGGFGAMLLMAHEWANPAATRRSFELIAQHVMPHFQGKTQGQGLSHAESTLTAKRIAEERRPGYAQAQLSAVDHMTEKYAQEVAEKKP
jgi:alkanesulfonate monooxygenase SsuD/methylene tetrahydromethanopterin reductase-like flavin-dependent oxidoreductase (luciferase family)